jgi:hypothetical protein
MSTDPEYLGPNEDAEEAVEASPSALAVISQSEHAAMVATANLDKNRRSIAKFLSTLEAYATHSQPVALGMFYSLPRANKMIVGPSVRFAEVVAPCWKNNSSGSRIVGIAENTVTAQGVFIDFEANMRNVKEVPRRITDSKGGRFNDDMILTTSRAALSIAYRDAILKGGVPQALWGPAYEAAKQIAVGKAMSHQQRIDAAMEFTGKLGITEWQVMNALGCASPKDMETDHLLTLKVLVQEIQKGEKTVEEVFGSKFDKEIDTLFVEQGKNAAEQRMLRASYRGRAEELLKYLQARQTSTQGNRVNTDPEPQQQTEKSSAPPAGQENAAPASGKKGAGKKNGKDKPEPEAKTETTAAPEQTAQTTEEKKPEPTQQETKAEPAQEGKFNF